MFVLVDHPGSWDQVQGLGGPAELAQGSIGRKSRNPSAFLQSGLFT